MQEHVAIANKSRDPPENVNTDDIGDDDDDFYFNDDSSDDENDYNNLACTGLFDVK